MGPIFAGRFGLLLALLVTVIVFSLMALRGRYYPHPVGLKVHTMAPGSSAQDPLILSLRCPDKDKLACRRPELALNCQPVAIDGLAAALRPELSRRAEWVVFVDADGWSNTGDVEQVVAAVQEAWSGVRVVLMRGTKSGPLTDQLK